MESRKNGDSNRTEVLKLIKAKLIEFKTQPKASELTENICNGILSKMVKELKGDLEIANANGREDLAKEAMYQIDTISEFLPKQATEEEINKYLDTLEPNIFIQKNMGNIVKAVKCAFASRDGAMVARIVKSRLK